MRQLLSGNEAIALGAYYAGASVGTAYPGTPSTEIIETYATYEGVHAEWAPNEQVALEVAVGASYGGVRALAAMKHVGLNVASDQFFAVSITGLNGGLVIVSADDPGMHSSQNEQDNRHYARFARVPVLEPSDSQEAFDFTRIAFDISERFDTPVIVRTTTRTSHSKSIVNIDAERLPFKNAVYKRDPQKYVMIPGHARRRHPVMEARITALKEYSETFPGHQMKIQDRSLGIVSAGAAFQYAMESYPNASYLRLGMAYPLPEKLIKTFAASVDRVVVVEELDPFFEEHIKLMGIETVGKEAFPLIGELSPEAVAAGFAKLGIKEPTAGPEPRDVSALPARPPVLCPGCSHRAIFYALFRLGLYQGPEKDGVIVAGDIGCYTLAVQPPLRAIDTTGCMGASIGNAAGFYRSGITKKVVAVIGDSTFLHSGVPGIMEIVYNRAPVTVIILDNSTTAMTGHQGHPGTGVTVQKQQTKATDIVALVKAIGVEDVQVIDPYDVKATMRTLRETVAREEPSVIIARRPCPLNVRFSQPVPRVVEEKCNLCGLCLQLGCPGLIKKENSVAIDPNVCVGCDMCVQVCARGGLVR